MIKRKLTSAQVTFIPKLRELGLPFREIGSMFGVSGKVVYYHVHPEKQKATMRRYLERKALLATPEGREQEATKIREAYERWKLAAGVGDDTGRQKEEVRLGN